MPRSSLTATSSRPISFSAATGAIPMPNTGAPSRRPRKMVPGLAPNFSASSILSSARGPLASCFTTRESRYTTKARASRWLSSASNFSSLPRRCAARSRTWVTKAGCPSGNFSNADIYSTQPDLAAKCADEILHFLGIMRQRRHHAPDRARPGDIAAAAGDDMNVKLRHQIAECGDIELVALGDVFQRARDPGNLRHQLRLLDLVEVDQLDRAIAARHQQQPRVMRVLDDQHPAQRQVADVDGVFLEP